MPRRICNLCQQPSQVLFAFPREQGLEEACAVCWLANEIVQLSSQLEDFDRELDCAIELLETTYRRFRERVSEQVQYSEAF